MSHATELLAFITEDAIDESVLRRAVDAPDCGAVVVFAGVVRDHDRGRAVTSLDYRSHPDAEKFLAECVQEEYERSGLRVAAAHRVGALRVGDTALVVAASSAHRPEAFECVERLAQSIKDRVPVWKRQHFDDGISEWVGL